jgi:phosphoglycerol transferase MdoB-like AlkP superfamily enzyme
VCLTCVGGRSFSHSMNTHELFMIFDGLLDSLSCGLGRVREHISRASLLVHDFILVMLLLVLLMLVPREPLAVLF